MPLPGLYCLAIIAVPKSPSHVDFRGYWLSTVQTAPLFKSSATGTASIGNSSARFGKEGMLGMLFTFLLIFLLVLSAYFRRKLSFYFQPAL